MNRHLLAASAALLLFCAPAFAARHDERQIAWNDLSQIIGKKVSVVMPQGTMIEGKVMTVDSDAMTVQVSKTNDAKAYAKGTLLVPRATLKTFYVSHPTHHGRVIFAVLGGVVGTVAGAAISLATAKSVLGPPNYVPVFAGAGVGSVGGYFLGQQVDKRGTTYVITQ